MKYSKIALSSILAIGTILSSLTVRPIQYSQRVFSGAAQTAHRLTPSNSVPQRLEIGAKATANHSLRAGSMWPGVQVNVETKPSSRFHSSYGYGLVDAAQAMGQATETVFAPLPNQGGSLWGPELVNAPEVWQQGYTGKGVVVAVVDTGVDYNHPDLAANIWVNKHEIANNGRDDDGNGYVDDVRGYDFVEQDADPMDETSPFNAGHGTHVAGAIAALNNDIGITGIAPDAQIMPIRVLDELGWGSGEQIAAGIRYAVENGATVINLSLGNHSELVETAILDAQKQGATVIMAAGNESGAVPFPPADLAKTVGLAVGAVNAQGKMGAFSNQAGPHPLSYVVAPGVAAYSTLPENRYAPMDGTSMAAPYVAGVAALLKAHNPAFSPSDIVAIILNAAQPLR